MTTQPTASIEAISFSSGQEFVFCPKEKIILVGPNNSGKSQTLRELLAISSNGAKERTVVVRGVRFAKTGTSAELKAYLDENSDYREETYFYKNWAINYRFVNQWEQPYFPNGLAAGYIKNINANDRLKICEQQKSVAPSEQKSKPQHVLYDDPILMGKISNLFRQAFSQDIMFDFRGGSILPIHVGNLPDPALVDRVGEDYVEAVRSNPLLDEQGDGMKSYAGILFEAIVADLDITLLDEPEAFLHPPQMRRLGETLASEVNGQLIVATHSSDIMRGFLEGTKGDVRILRIQRDGDTNVVSEPEPEVIKELWSRPELRYSNALESVFHEQAIICEDDSDCRLFNAVADHLSSLTDDAWKDTAYIPTGGKHGVKKIAKVLRKIGVPIKAIFDIDFLNDEALVSDTIEAFGGVWENFQPNWRRLDAAVRSGVRPKTNQEIKQNISHIIDTAASDALPRSDISEAMKQGSSWNIVKRAGVAGIPSGDAQRYFNSLRDDLQNIGIYLVHVGEVENFCREIGGHGPKFVNQVLSEIELSDPRLQELRAFVECAHTGKHAPLENSMPVEADEQQAPPE